MDEKSLSGGLTGRRGKDSLFPMGEASGPDVHGQKSIGTGSRLPSCFDLRGVVRRIAKRTTLHVGKFETDKNIDGILGSRVFDDNHDIGQAKFLDERSDTSRPSRTRMNPELSRLVDPQTATARRLPQGRLTHVGLAQDE